MPTFDAEYPEPRTVSAARLCLGLLLTALLCVWIGQQSINAYWLEHYHRASPLAALDRFPLWRAGGAAHKTVGDLCARYLPALNPSGGTVAHASDPKDAENAGESEAGKTELAATAKQPVEAAVAIQKKPQPAAPKPQSAAKQTAQSTKTTKQTAKTANQTPKPVAPSAPKRTAAAPQMAQPKPPAQPAQARRQQPTPGPDDQLLAAIPAWARPQPPPQPPRQTPSGPDVTLRADDEVLFAGDSLMEGVAPHVSHWLKRNGVKSNNRSRRSTGLSYPNPKVRDWPREIETVLAGNPNVKLVVIFLGPNDPGGFPDPEAPRRRFLRFQSEAWENVYRDRIGRILTAAEQHGARVIWMGLPYMRKAELNRQMAYLDEVMRSETAESALALFIPTKDLLSVTGAYSDSIPVNGKHVTVRAKDGIHFTPSGQRILARAIQERIAILPKPGGEGGETALP